MKIPPFYLAANWNKFHKDAGLLKKVQEANKHFSQGAYKIPFDLQHPPGATRKRILHIYQVRWIPFAGILLAPSTNIAVERAMKSLKSLAARVPPRIHNANVRFHLNGFHTARRYQIQNSLCLFCNRPGSEDSLEHMMRCEEMQCIFPQDLK